MFVRPSSILLLAAWPLTVSAQAGDLPDAGARAVYDGLALPEIIDVMAREGAEYGDALAETMFAGSPVPPGWTDAVADIYDPALMQEAVLGSLEATLADADTAPMVDFLADEPGRSMVALELAAREAMLDDDVEAAAKEAAAVAMADETARLDLLRRYAEANDLVETNVVGAMNTNTAYFMGLMDGGAIDQDMSESDVLADVWSQEAQIRADTTEWVYSFLLLAYAPASDEDLEALIAFSETEPGQELNRAVFVAFDGLMEDISRALGLASARYMTTEQL